MILTGLALAFAMIPEELPIIVTMVLGLGAFQLSKNNFLVKKVKAAEVLGTVTTILTDKTGTITENVMKAVAVYPPESEGKVLSMASNSMTEISLSPTDRAIMDRCRTQKIEGWGQVIRERSFDSVSKTRSILRQNDDGFELYVTGAPEKLLCISSPIPGLEEELRKDAAKGRRVIAVAHKKVLPESENLPFEELEKGLEIAGLISIEDTPRERVKETIETAGSAGIRTIMVTGDHPLTAAYIAGRTAIPNQKVLTGAELDAMSDDDLKKAVREVSVFARATPEHKYRLVKALRANGEVVAVTGDGINDVLALKGADVGISMGIKGTDVSKDAADIVLADDNFVTITRGIFEGRKFFDNVRKGIKYYLSAKVALVLLFLLPVIVGLPMPFSPVQIILLELFMDLGASVGFVAEPAERSVYKLRPGSNARIFEKKTVLGIALSGISLFAAVAIRYAYALSQGMGTAQVQTIAFCAWIVGHIFLAFVSRSDRESLISMGPLKNRAMDLWALAAFGFLAVVVSVPFIGSNLKLTTLDPALIVLAIVVAFIAVFWLEIPKALGVLGDKVT
jgi:Ca2+-transporting ATPase